MKKYALALVAVTVLTAFFALSLGIGGMPPTGVSDEGSALGGSNSPNTPSPGNNGTVKIDDLDFDQWHDNDPHPKCVFNVKWFNFDPTLIKTTVLFEGQPPTGGNELLKRSFTFTGGKGQNFEQTFDLTQALQSIQPQKNQGWHVKLTIHAPFSNGADEKHKVFWVSGCEPTPTATPTKTPTLTRLPPPPTQTPSRTPTVTPSRTPTSTRTGTPTASATPTVTNTPTKTPTGTLSPSPSPTNTSPPGVSTDTPVPTGTSAPGPTNTTQPTTASTEVPPEKVKKIVPGVDDETGDANVQDPVPQQPVDDGTSTVVGLVTLIVLLIAAQKFRFK